MRHDSNSTTDGQTFLSIYSYIYMLVKGSVLIVKER